MKRGFTGWGTIMDYQTFKNEMLNYRAYKRSIDELNEKIEILWYEMTGVKGISYDKQPTSYNPIIAEEVRSKYSEQIEELNLALDHTLIKIQDIEKHLGMLPVQTQTICKLLFMERLSYRTVGMTYGYTDQGLRKRIIREVEKL